MALRSAGPEAITDVIDLFDPAALARLASYADGHTTGARPGFWSEAELAPRG